MPLENSNTEISLYDKGKVSSKCWIENVFLLKNAFPELQKGFYDILEKLLDEEGFNDERFTDAVITLIKTHSYPKPQIANILGYDKKVKTFTHWDLLEITKDYSPESRKKYIDQYVFVQSLQKYVEKTFADFFK